MPSGRSRRSRWPAARRRRGLAALEAHALLQMYPCVSGRPRCDYRGRAWPSQADGPPGPALKSLSPVLAKRLQGQQVLRRFPSADELSTSLADENFRWPRALVEVGRAAGCVGPALSNHEEIPNIQRRQRAVTIQDVTGLHQVPGKPISD